MQRPTSTLLESLSLVVLWLSVVDPPCPPLAGPALPPFAGPPVPLPPVTVFVASPLMPPLALPLSPPFPALLLPLLLPLLVRPMVGPPIATDGAPLPPAPVVPPFALPLVTAPLLFAVPPVPLASAEPAWDVPPAPPGFVSAEAIPAPADRANVAIAIAVMARFMVFDNVNLLVWVRRFSCAHRTRPECGSDCGPEYRSISNSRAVNNYNCEPLGEEGPSSSGGKHLTPNMSVSSEMPPAVSASAKASHRAQHRSGRSAASRFAFIHTDSRGCLSRRS